MLLGSTEAFPYMAGLVLLGSTEAFPYIAEEPPMEGPATTEPLNGFANGEDETTAPLLDCIDAPKLDCPYWPDVTVAP